MAKSWPAEIPPLGDRDLAKMSSITCRACNMLGLVFLSCEACFLRCFRVKFRRCLARICICARLSGRT